MNDQEFCVSLVEQDPSYILCKVHVDLTIPIATRMIQALRQLGAESNTLLYLVDVRGVRNVAGPGENYQFTQTELKDLKAVPNDVALLIDLDDHSHIFIETLARNAGHNVKIFHSNALAISWLKSKTLSY